MWMVCIDRPTTLPTTTTHTPAAVLPLLDERPCRYFKQLSSSATTSTSPHDKNKHQTLNRIGNLQKRYLSTDRRTSTTIEACSLFPLLFLFFYTYTRLTKTNRRLHYSLLTTTTMNLHAYSHIHNGFETPPTTFPSFLPSDDFYWLLDWLTDLIVAVCFHLIASNNHPPTIILSKRHRCFTEQCFRATWVSKFLLRFLLSIRLFIIFSCYIFLFRFNRHHTTTITPS